MGQWYWQDVEVRFYVGRGYPDGGQIALTSSARLLFVYPDGDKVPAGKDELLQPLSQLP